MVLKGHNLGHQDNWVAVAFQIGKGKGKKMRKGDEEVRWLRNCLTSVGARYSVSRPD